MIKASIKLKVANQNSKFLPVDIQDLKNLQLVMLFDTKRYSEHNLYSPYSSQNSQKSRLEINLKHLLVWSILMALYMNFREVYISEESTIFISIFS